MKPYLKYLFLASLIINSDVAQSNVYLDNPPKPINLSALGYFSAIGELESAEIVFDEDGIASRRYGTGFLVGPCHILTNSHVVYGKDTAPIPGKDYSMTFRIGKGKTTPFLGSVTAEIAIASKRSSGGGNDWALMRLKSCIGCRPEFGWYDSADRNDAQLVGHTIEVAGYPGYASRGDMKYSSGVITGIQRGNGNLKHSASMFYGTSGSPVLVVVDNEIRVAGLNTRQNIDASKKDPSTYSTYSDARSNEFQNASAILKSSLVIEKLGRLGCPNVRKKYLASEWLG